MVRGRETSIAGLVRLFLGFLGHHLTCICASFTFLWTAFRTKSIDETRLAMHRNYCHYPRTPLMWEGLIIRHNGKNLTVIATPDNMLAKDIILNELPEIDSKTAFLNPLSGPKTKCSLLPLTELNISNPRNFDISGSSAWIPTESLARVKAQTSIKVEADSPNCKLFILAPTASGTMTLIIKGPNIKFTSLSRLRMSFTARLVRTSSLTIGEGTFIASARMVLLNTDVKIGAGGLWSDEILIQGSDQHGIIDLKTKSIINGGRRSVEIGRHVWIGRRAIISKDIKIGAGSIVGTGAIVTKDVPSSVIVAGTPAKVIRRDVSWINDIEKINPKESADIEELCAAVSNDSRKTEKSILRRLISKLYRKQPKP